MNEEAAEEGGDGEAAEAGARWYASSDAGEARIAKESDGSDSWRRASSLSMARV